MKINIAQKLSSRKLWAAIVAAASAIAVALFKDQLSAEAVSLIEKAVLALCVYIGGESVVDVARAIFNYIGVITSVEEEPIEGDTEDEPAEQNAVPSLDSKVEHTIVGFNIGGGNG